MTAFAQIVAASQSVRATSRRNDKIAILAECLRRLAPDEVVPVVDYLSGNVRQGKIGVGFRNLAGAAAPAAAAATLAVLDVDAALTSLAGISGAGSESVRREALQALLGRATTDEQRFLVALLTGELRQGALEGVMLEAVAKAAGLPAERVQRAAMLAGGLARVAAAALAEGDAGLARFAAAPGRPLQPMLAQTSEDPEDALLQLGEAALELKVDGARVQVHKTGGDVAVFTRSLNEVTPAVPEIVELAHALPARELILDGEIVALDERGRPRPFQETMRRFGRRRDVARLRAELPLSPFLFDLLYLDGRSLLDAPQRERRAALAGVLPAGALVPDLVTADVAAAQRFFEQALEAGHEGIMAKDPAAGYAAGSRGSSWLKVKKAKTLDLVILAAEWGNGRREGFLSNLHLGARDTDNGGYAMLGKTFKGLTDAMLRWQTEKLLEAEISRDANTVYVEPKIVVEIAYHELQTSTRYPSGLALRFARVKRYRTDKTPEQADSVASLNRSDPREPRP